MNELMNKQTMMHLLLITSE